MVAKMRKVKKKEKEVGEGRLLKSEINQRRLEVGVVERGTNKYGSPHIVHSLSFVTVIVTVGLLIL